MDIIFNIGSAGISGTFCGVNDTFFKVLPSITPQDGSTFAIRFHAWAVPLFADEHLRSVLNFIGPMDAYFPGLRTQLESVLPDSGSIYERVRIVEPYLIKRLNILRRRDDVMNAVHAITGSRGVIRLDDAARYAGVGNRQMERLFAEYVGLTPKRFSSLVRYQFLWREMLTQRNFDVHDAVLRFGYTDQSHLVRDFKRFHSMSPGDALRHASVST